MFLGKFFDLFNIHYTTEKHLDILNVVLVHKKGAKQCLNNYRPVSFGLLKRQIFNEMFRFLIENNFISPN